MSHFIVAIVAIACSAVCLKKEADEGINLSSTSSMESFSRRNKYSVPGNRAVHEVKKGS
jgi:hypothetical protein